MSPTAIQSDLGIAARRAQVQLPAGSEAAKQAEALVRQGHSVEEAVQQFGTPARPYATADETKLFFELRARGKTEAQAREAIQAARALKASLGTKTPTVPETKFPKGMRGGKNPMKPLTPKGSQ